MSEKLRLLYDRPAPDDDKGSYVGTGSYLDVDNGIVGWERYALPIGNGYSGAVVFGGIEHERIQLTDNTLGTLNPADSDYGVANFAEVYVDFIHKENEISDYSRELNLGNATIFVNYKCGKSEYCRQYIASYPDKVIAAHFTCSGEDRLNFKVRVTVPYYDSDEPCMKRTAEFSVSNDAVYLKGVFGVFDEQYFGAFKVRSDGVTSCDEKSGTLSVAGASDATLYIRIGTNYPIGCPEVFGEEESDVGYDAENGTLTISAHGESRTSERLQKFKLDEYVLIGDVIAASDLGWENIYMRHVADYSSIFERVYLNINNSEPKAITTDRLLEEYRSGGNENVRSYLEELMFAYGRYLLISSSRPGSLPANLTGTWNRYERSVCGAGYWHNINTQMNYWPSFVTDIPETYEPYITFLKAMMPTLKRQSASVIKKIAPENYSPNGENGWNIGTGIRQFRTYSSGGNGIDGFACGAFASETIWDAWLFTQDKKLLKDFVFPTVYGSAQFMSRIARKQSDGKFLIEKSGSPENHVDFCPVGVTYDQSMALDIIDHAVSGAETLGVCNAETERMKFLMDKLDPIIIGKSGQIKEFREETYYAEFGEKHHRHTSQLVGVYPGTVISSDTPAWMDSAERTLELRGYPQAGWSCSHRMCIYSRLKNGDCAYKMLKTLISDQTNPNLLTRLYNNYFQIEANFGATAGISEMLLQSHEGVIDILPALPVEWKSGEYRGLVARGNFRIGVKWNDKFAERISVFSRTGNKCRIRYPGIAFAKLRDCSGKAVKFDSDGTDVISFQTKDNCEYVFSDFIHIDVPERVKNLTCISDNSRLELSWSYPCSEIKCFRIYNTQLGNGSYSLLGETCSNEYSISNFSEGMYAVTAVDSSGRDSRRNYFYISQN